MAVTIFPLVTAYFFSELKTLPMRKIFFGLLSLTVLSLSAQNAAPRVLTLDECIEFALENNIALKRAKNEQLIARANRFQAIMNFFPSLNAGINYDYYFGNFFDQNAARQVSETSNSSNPNLSSSVMLFNGFSNQYTLKRRINEQVSSDERVNSAILNVKSNILSFYLSVAIGKENLNISSERVKLLETQLDRELKRVEVGVGNMESVYALRAQLSTGKLNLTNDRNTLRTNLLQLIQEMQLDTSIEYDIEEIDIDDKSLLLEIDPFAEVLSKALNINPNLRSAEADRNASQYALKEARASRLPTISAFGRIGSNYSSNGARNPESGAFEADATFQDQIGYNQFEYINFSLNIPIFTQFTRSTNVQTSKIGMLNAELNQKQTENTITNTVQLVYLDLVTAQRTLLSAQENMEAQRSSFEFIKKRFDIGNTDFNAYLESLNNKNQAEFQMVSSKYRILFRKKILDLYTQ